MGLFGKLFGKGKKYDEDIEQISDAIFLFMQDSEKLFFDDLKSISQSPRAGRMLAYQIGATDFLTQAAGYDDEKSILDATFTLNTKYYHMEPNEARENARNIIESVLNPAVSSVRLPYMTEGGNAMKQWMEGDNRKGGNATALKLNEIMTGKK
jgi:hypothetical protein